MTVNCKISTPYKYVDIMLNEVGYVSDIYNKKVLENSCGSGNIITKIVERYIKDAIASQVSLNEIKIGLERDIWGFETDYELISQCKQNLDVIANKYMINNVAWNLINEDVLKNNNIKFQYIISNPPYITYNDLTKTERKELKERYVSCKKGRFDYYYAFLEHAINNLDVNGKAIFFIPNSILKNVHAKTIRKITEKYLVSIIDFTNEDVFSKITISPIMFTCYKNNNINEVLIKDENCNVKRKLLKNKHIDKWYLYENNNQKYNHRFGDYFKVRNSIATLNNDVFIFDECDIDINFEKELLIKAVSPKSFKNSKNKIAIFPYKIESNKISKISEEEFIKNYPQIYNYLLTKKNKLKKQDVGNKVPWFEYGRNQALESIFYDKLIVPMVFSKNVNVYFSNKMEMPFAGYYIIAKADLNLEIAKKILLSNKFLEYVKAFGTKTNTSTYRMSCKDIEEFKF